MNCSSVDVKAYAFGEAGNPGEAAHIESCENCREELARLRATQTALLSLPDEEIPQRIAFVSDKIFEPRWWQRIWRSAPAMGFASAALIAGAILVHAYTRPAEIAPAPAVDTARIEQRIESEVARRVDLRVSEAVAKVTSESAERQAKAARLLEAAEKKFALERQSDIAMIQQTARYWQDKFGQLMQASNRSGL